MKYKLTIEMRDRDTNNIVNTYVCLFSTEKEAYLNALDLACMLPENYHYYKYKVEEVR